MLGDQNRKHHVVVSFGKTRQSHRPSRSFTTQPRHPSRGRGQQSFRRLIANVIVVPWITSELSGVGHDPVDLVRLENLRQPSLSRLGGEQHAPNQQHGNQSRRHEEHQQMTNSTSSGDQDGDEGRDKEQGGSEIGLHHDQTAGNCRQCHRTKQPGQPPVRVAGIQQPGHQQAPRHPGQL